MITNPCFQKTEMADNPPALIALVHLIFPSNRHNILAGAAGDLLGKPASLLVTTILRNNSVHSTSTVQRIST